LVRPINVDLLSAAWIGIGHGVSLVSAALPEWLTGARDTSCMVPWSKSRTVMAKSAVVYKYALRRTCECMAAAVVIGGQRLGAASVGPSSVVASEKL
jgi:hypothetical protein